MQKNSKPEKSSQPAASGKGGASPAKSETSRISNGSANAKPVGPKNAPYYGKCG